MRTIKLILFICLLINAFSVQGEPEQPERVVDLRGYWQFSIGDNLKWAEADFDDNEWTVMFVPAAWENEGFHGYDGYAWYRTTFDLKKDKNQAYFIDLGYIDDVDQVFINGEMIGFTGSFPPNFKTAFDSKRRYFIPEEFLNEGMNVIAVRVYDTVLEGGIIKGRPGIYVESNMPSQSYVLEGLWKFREGQRDRYRDKDYDDSDWELVKVPHFWAAYKHMKITRYGTYRKEFELPDKLRNQKELVLILGKIDDFDRVYLNGKLIGFTNDGKPFGRSESYNEYRIYALLNSALNRNGKNILTVEVEDMGWNAGIYQGPIGIATSENYQRFIEIFNFY